MNKLFLFSIVFSVALSTQATYLKWQVGEDVGDDFTDLEGYESEVGVWKYATLYRFKINDEGKVYDKSAVDSGTDWAEQKTVGPLGSLLNPTGVTASEYSYVIELSNDTCVIGYSETATYAQLAGNIYETELPETVPTSVTAWHGGTYKAVPEPTSAMLMLIGVAGLALRRKQRKA